MSGPTTTRASFQTIRPTQTPVHLFVGDKKRPAGVRRGLVANVVAGVVVSLMIANVTSPAAGTVTPTPKVPHGYHTVTIHQVGLSMLVPDAWVKADLSGQPIDRFLHRLEKTDPSEARFLTQQHDALAKDAFYTAIDTHTGTIGDALTVLAVPSADGSPFIPTGQGPASSTQFQQHTGLSNVAVTDGTLGGAPAANLTGIARVPVAKRRPLTLHGTGYIVATQHGSLEIDFVGPTDSPRDKIIQTMIHSVTLDAVTLPFDVAGTGTQDANGAHGTATGSVINNGSFTYTTRIPGQPPLCGQGPGEPINASINLAATSGDVLNYSFSGTVCQSGTHDIPGFSLFIFDGTGTYNITGGTGCFTEATGSGAGSAHVEFDSITTASIAFSDKGTITLKKQPNCP